MRRLEAEQAVQPDLARRARNKVASANDLGHARKSVIDRHRKLIGEHAVRAADDEVAAFLCEVFAVFAEYAVCERDFLVRHAHTGRRRTFLALFRDFLG